MTKVPGLVDTAIQVPGGEVGFLHCLELLAGPTLVGNEGINLYWLVYWG